MTAVLPFVLRYWKIILGGLITSILVIALLIARGDARHNLKLYEAEKAAHALDLANVKAVTAKAVADNIADVRDKENDAAVITKDKQHDLESQLADARASAANYAKRMRCPSNASAGNTSSPAVGQTTGATSEPGGTGSMPVMVSADDVQICSVAVVKAKGWQYFYSALRARYNETTTP